MELQARVGRGYVSADTNKQLYQTQNQPLGTIYTDAIYTPVEQVSYLSEPTRVGQNAKYDKVTLEITTDAGGICRLGCKDPDRSSAAADQGR